MHPVRTESGLAPTAPTLLVGRGDDMAALRKLLAKSLGTGESHVRLDGVLLREIRAQRVETIAACAVRARIDPRVWARAEESKPIHRTTAVSIAKAIDRPPEDLIQQSVQPERALIVVHGIPGVGKTSLARSLAHDPGLTGAFPDGILWTSLGQSPVLREVLVRWARALGVDDAVEKGKEEEIRERLTALLRNKRVLLIIDDAWDAKQAWDLLVGGTNCSALVTTRLDQVADALAPTEKDLYRLGVLSQASALDLLEALAGSVIENYRNESEELVVAVERLPIALQVAGHLLREERHSLDVAGLLRDLQDPSTYGRLELPVDVELPCERTIFGLFKKSTDMLPADARKCFAYLGPYAPKPARFNSIALAAQWKKIAVDPRQMARLIIARGLLEPVGQDLYWLHALLKAHAAAILAAS